MDFQKHALHKLDMETQEQHCKLFLNTSLHLICLLNILMGGK